MKQECSTFCYFLPCAYCGKCLISQSENPPVLRSFQSSGFLSLSLSLSFSLSLSLSLFFLFFLATSGRACRSQLQLREFLLRTVREGRVP